MRAVRAVDLSPISQAPCCANLGAWGSRDKDKRRVMKKKQGKRDIGGIIITIIYAIDVIVAIVFALAIIAALTIAASVLFFDTAIRQGWL